MDGDRQTIEHAEALLDLRRYAEAEQRFRDALVHDPESVPALSGLARSLTRQGRHEEAETAARTATALAPEEASAHHLHSRLFTTAR